MCRFHLCLDMTQNWKWDYFRGRKDPWESWKGGQWRVLRDKYEKIWWLEYVCENVVRCPLFWMLIKLKRWWLGVFSFSCNPGNIHNLRVCTHIHTETCTETPLFTSHTEEFRPYQEQLYHGTYLSPSWGCFCVWGIHAQVWRAEIEVRCLPLFHATLFVWGFSLNLEEINVLVWLARMLKGSVFSLISLDTSLCDQLFIRVLEIHTQVLMSSQRWLCHQSHPSGLWAACNLHWNEKVNQV